VQDAALDGGGEFHLTQPLFQEYLKFKS
jgi:hypothetical protein